MQIKAMEQNLFIGENKTLPSKAEIQDWIVAYLAKLLEVDTEEINVTIPFDRYGLNSAAAVGLTGDLEEWLRMEIDPTIFYDYPTVETLAQCLSQPHP